MKESTLLQKLGASAVNVAVVLILFIPFYFVLDNNFERKIVLIAIFFIYHLIFMFLNNNRCIGMIVMRTRYVKRYPKPHYFLYTVLYTLSFSTLLFHIFFPFDLFIFNMLFLQLPILLTNKTTLHGYLAGDIKSVRC